MTKHVMMSGAALASMIAAMPAAATHAPRMEVAGGVEALLQQVRQELTRVGDDVRRTAEDALKQASQTGTLTAETKAQSDRMLSQFHELSGAHQKLEGKLEALETRNLDLEQSVAQGGGRGGARTAMSVGQEIAGSDQLKAWLANGAQGGLTLRPTNAITSAAGSAGGLIWETQERAPVNMPRRTLPVRSLLSQATTDSDLVKFTKQVLREQNAAMVAEGVAPPAASNYGWTQAEAAVRKIVAFTHVSDEALADAGQLQAAIDGELRYDVDVKEDKQILSGDGVGQNLSGLLSEAAAFVAAAGLPNDTRIDRLRLGLLQVALNDYAATGITLHPTDWAAIELLKDTSGRYIFGDPNVLSTPRLWGLDAVATASHGLGEWMVGNFAMAATIYDREDVEVLISSEHGNNFIEGMKTIKATKRLTLAIKRGPTALVTGNFTFGV